MNGPEVPSLLRFAPALLLAAFFAGFASAAPIVLNEYNGVGNTAFLNGGVLGSDDDGGTAADPAFGRVLGNGGDWFELVVIADHLDARGFKLDIFVLGVFDTRLELSADSVWSDLRAGTIITVAEDVPDDPSYDPTSGDWTIQVQANGDPLVTTGGFVTAANFPTNNNGWQLEISDADEALVFGPAGEGVAPGIGVSNIEVFKLEAHPSILVTPTSPDYEDGTVSTFGAPNVWGQGGSAQDLSPLRTGPVGDRDGDGIFDDGDRSGWLGDSPCAPGQSAGCDDVCPVAYDPGQTGVACLCGDANDDGSISPVDVTALRGWLAREDGASIDLGKCSADDDGDCTIRDLVILRRQLEGSGPGIGGSCHARAVPDDPTELLFPPHRLLEVTVTMASGDWDALRNESRDILATFGGDCMDAPFESPFLFYPASVTVDGETVSSVGIRKKGFLGSLDSIRPSLKIDFGEFVGGQKHLGLARLTLNNDKQDPSHVDQCVGYQLFREAGVPAPRCSFAHVTVNGEDLGIYSHIESVKRPFLSRHFPRTSGNLYEGTLSDFRDPWLNTFERKTNTDDPLRADLDAVAAALVVPDASLEAAVSGVVDLPAFYTFWAMENLIGHIDGYQGAGNNFWIYFEPTTGLAHFIPWGIDTTMNGAMVLLGEGEPVPVNRPRMRLPRRLYLNPPTRDDYATRLFELLDSVWLEGRILNEIDRIEYLIAAITGDISAPLEGRRDFVRDRREEFETAFAGGPPAWSEDPFAPFCIGVVGTFDATCTTTYGSLGPFDGTGQLQVVYDGSPIPFVAEACGAGPDEGVPGLSTLRFAGAHENGNIVVLNAMTYPAWFTPGIVPLEETLPALVLIPTGGGPLLPIGMGLEGDITFTQAGANPGDPIQATSSGQILDWVTLETP